ncbi:hypothetical protein M514_05506 [Trichuris suis]|nr:hypothetical protein M514_05506 [Trichuris suis]KHJ47008.1 hypothetical protein D918_02553 [Trichuris suis]
MIATKIFVLAVAAFCFVTKAFRVKSKEADTLAIIEEVKRTLHRADWKDAMPYWRRVVDLVSVEKNGKTYNVTFSALFTDCELSSYPAYVFEDFMKYPRLEQAHMEIINSRRECMPFPEGPMLLCQTICQISNDLEKSAVDCKEMMDTEV